MQMITDMDVRFLATVYSWQLAEWTKPSLMPYKQFESIKFCQTAQDVFIQSFPPKYNREN